jgi:hypothetical protein
MILSRHILTAAIAALMGIPCASAQEPTQVSPVTPGYWIWPREKLSPQAIADECRSRFTVQLGDGSYFTVKLRDGVNGKLLAPPQLVEAGQCKFNRETQTETCEMRSYRAEGGTFTWNIESRFSLDDGVLRMNVTPTVNGKQERSFDIYPAQCPGGMRELTRE